jgi:hypothetical protein
VNDPAFADDRPADKPFTDLDWWVCQIHAPECLHCNFVSGGVSRFSLEPCVLHDKASELIGRGLRCWFCFCTFDPRLDLIESGESCAIWGRGPRPGTFGSLLLDEPDLFQKFLDWRAEQEAKSEWFEQWRKQLG